MNPLQQLAASGQAAWFDYIRRSLITGGELQRMVERDGLRGVTANPTIFEKAITGSRDYVDELRELAQERTLNAVAIYERVAIKDVQLAADIMMPAYHATAGRDGYVSLEVSPALAHDTDGTCEQARRLWRALDRPNVMIQVPATAAGIPAIEQLISAGINVNVTLIFSREVYDQVAEAYISGVEWMATAGGDVRRVASVASFFVSRIDTAIDALASGRLAEKDALSTQTRLQDVLGSVAVANARLAYARYKAILNEPRWKALEKRGARSQRLLWASTGTKNPRYRDVYYVEELIGPDTVNTIPPTTYGAFRDHGRVRSSLEENLEAARETMRVLQDERGISLREVTDRLLEDGLRLFAQAFDKQLAAVVAPRHAPCRPVLNRQNTSLPRDLGALMDEAVDEWQRRGKVERLWAGDASLWSGTDEGEWMGWLAVTEDQLAHLDHLRRIVRSVREEGFTDALLLGMGGSSLCPEVLSKTFGQIDGAPKLHVLDSTDPAQIRWFEGQIDVERTLFIVSSKSGSTLEPNILKQYFFDRVSQHVGPNAAGTHFIAITDPGSKLENVATRDEFRGVFHGVPSIGGRYSALSDCGMIPAAVMGLDVERLLDRADEMVHACAACVPVAENPGVALGLLLGVAGRRGRDKITLITSPGISDLGAWLEQLLAESTGKDGRGLIPVDGERLGAATVYGTDRLFVYLRLEVAPNRDQDFAVERLERGGHPVVRIDLRDPYDVGQEFFRWEIATAVAASILGINPFNQPDVEASKNTTRTLTEAYEASGSLPAETPFVEDDGFALFTDEANVAALRATAGGLTPEAILRAHLDRLSSGNYFALLAYIEMTESHHKELQAIRHRVRDAKRVATCLGYGPRFLHSTGQAYKGGPNTGVFLQVTCEDAVDLPVPGQGYSFGVVKAAQARGDFQVLAERERRALRVHLGPDVGRGLTRVRQILERVVK